MTVLPWQCSQGSIPLSSLHKVELEMSPESKAIERFPSAISQMERVSRDQHDEECVQSFLDSFHQLMATLDPAFQVSGCEACRDADSNAFEHPERGVSGKSQLEKAPIHRAEVSERVGAPVSEARDHIDSIPQALIPRQ
jgi:hypothetical protein